MGIGPEPPRAPGEHFGDPDTVRGQMLPQERDRDVGGLPPRVSFSTENGMIAQNTRKLCSKPPRHCGTLYK